jgi:ABC-2 type transport system ATP-binding protein
MEEAERLADCVVVIDAGRTVAAGAVAELVGNDRRSLQDVFLELTSRPT